MAREASLFCRLARRPAQPAVAAIAACIALSAAFVSCRLPSGPGTVPGGTTGPQAAATTATIPDKAWWGRWLRLDLEEAWYIGSAAVSREGDSMAVRAWDEATGVASLDGLTLARRSENVIAVNSGQYYLFRKSGVRGSLIGNLASMSSAKALSLPGIIGVQVSIANALNPANSAAREAAVDGSFSFADIIPSDSYSLQTSLVAADGSKAAGPALTVTTKTDRENIGTITLADLPYNFKVSATVDDAAADLVADGQPRDVTISIRNIGSGDSLEGATFSFPAQQGLSVASSADPILGTIVPGSAKTIAAAVSCEPIDTEYADRSLSIRIADANANVWNDSVQFRFYRAPMTVSILSLNHPVNGIILTPEKEGVWFRTRPTTGAEYRTTATVPYRERGYLLCLSGASVETETRYSVGFDVAPLGAAELQALADTSVYEPNGDETAAWPIGLGQSIGAYLHSGDIDFYGIGLKAAKPVFAPNGGAYLSPQVVSLACATAGATIRYSTDGSDPRIAGIRYDGAFVVSPPATVKAVATKSGWGDSEIASASFLPKAIAPTPVPASGDFEDPITVTLTTPTPGAAILYALDGADPSAPGSSSYSGPFAVTPPATVSAIARKAGFGDSAVATASYVLKVKPPTISPAAGAYAESLFDVYLGSPTEGASIRYTLDGSDPADRANPSALLYSGPFQIGTPTTVRALCVKDACADSDETSATYLPRVHAPLVSPADGTYGIYGINVALSSPTQGCEIHYTVDGSEPSAASPLYSSMILVPNSQTVVKSFARKAGMVDSAVSIAVYNPGIPIKLVAGGSYSMGSTSSLDNGASPVHGATVSDFMLSMYEIRQSDFLAAMGFNPSVNGGTGKESYPVENVSWLDAIAFCNALSQAQGLQTVYAISGSSVAADFSKNGYRLPTEAEWEFAARGGTAATVSTTYSGSSTASTVAWYDATSSNSTHPVGSKSANALGLYDLSGNAWEWCWDWYADYPGTEAVDPRGPETGADRVMRGGDFKNTLTKCRVTYRGFNVPSYSSNGTGLRIARRIGAGTGAGGSTVSGGRDKTGTGNTGGGGLTFP